MAEIDNEGLFEKIADEMVPEAEAAKTKKKVTDFWQDLARKFDLEGALRKILEDDFLYGDLFGKAREWVIEICENCKTKNCILLGSHPDYDAEYFTCFACKHSTHIEGAIDTGITKAGYKHPSDYKEPDTRLARLKDVNA